MGPGRTTGGGGMSYHSGAKGSGYHGLRGPSEVMKKSQTAVSFWEGERCEYCNGLIREKTTDLSRKVLAIIRKRRNLNFGRRSRPQSGSTPPAQRAERIDPMALAPTDGTPGRFGGPDDARRGDRSGTLIRHARPTVPLPVGSLANAVSVSARRRPLITTVGAAPLLPPSCRSALGAAIALTAVATAAHKEQRATAWAATKTWAQRRFRSCRRDFGAHLITIPRIADDWTDDRAFGADDVAGASTPAKGSENYVFR